MARALIVTLLFVVLTPGLDGQSTSRDTAAKRVVGMWRLVSITSDDGAADPNRGARPIGLIAYDESGHMAVQIMPDRQRPKYAGTQPTPAEAKEALTGYTAYFGTYTIDERAGTVTHHREGSINPGGVKVDLVRRYEFASGDRLILTPVENPKRHLTWERVRRQK